ncbi:6-carboxytetrahydropterin synthase [Chitinispirillales bacterium ANBcel5]|uniref:6-pyruvoyl trahydropterin synthase family protein n=1 Tax=Cellulosispirillum alkaliphilum TaxID=3039283 RepID=UPI002A5582FB|nr:6-carboxytetrahydropterin synthase [Chitinispirillales bacterium ANBcel5]
MYEITTESHFSAAHRLRDYSGPCENIHGHNWLVRATYRCSELQKNGIGIDFKILKGKLKDILEEFDHKDLNLVLGGEDGLNPSSENLARYIFEKLEKALVDHSGSVARVEVHETPGNLAAYFK